MTDHDIRVVHDPFGDRCVYSAVCDGCGALSEVIEVTHTPDDPEACGRARRSLYQWGRTHGGE